MDGSAREVLLRPLNARITGSLERDGYRVDIDRLRFLSPELRNQLRLNAGAPRLSGRFESSIPGLYFPVTRAMKVRVTAVELDGTPLAFDAEEFLARILQHETDHVNGILFIDRLSTDDRKEAMRLIREQQLGLAGSGADPSRAL